MVRQAPIANFIYRPKAEVALAEQGLAVEFSMGNRKSREVMLRQQEDALWHRIGTEPRPASLDVSAKGIGALRMQLIVRPAFEKAWAWEVRIGPQGWCLYRPQVLNSSSEVQLIGCDSLAFPADQLAAFFDRICALSLPIAPDLSGFGGCDGTMHQLAVFGDLHSSWRFHWWSDSPKQWRPLIDIASEMLAAFSGIKG